jgi:hypothetical protein
MVMKYRFISTSTGGRTFTSPEEGKSLPIGDSYHVEHTVFNKVDFSDEFPKTCKFVEVQVCPAYPAKLAKPTAAGVPAYYKPFHDGEPAEGCRNAVNLDAVDLPVPDGPKGCMAVVHGRVYNKQLYDEYGYFKRGYWANGAKTQDEAVQQATAKAQADGFHLDDGSQPNLVDCDHPHGAMVGLRKVGTARWNIEPVGVWDDIQGAAGSSKKAAEQTALGKCNATLTRASMISIYVNHGVTSCELIASW